MAGPRSSASRALAGLRAGRRGRAARPRTPRKRSAAWRSLPPTSRSWCSPPARPPARRRSRGRGRRPAGGDAVRTGAGALAPVAGVPAAARPGARPSHRRPRAPRRPQRSSTRGAKRKRPPAAARRGPGGRRRRRRGRRSRWPRAGPAIVLAARREAYEELQRGSSPRRRPARRARLRGCCAGCRLAAETAGPGAHGHRSRRPAGVVAPIGRGGRRLSLPGLADQAVDALAGQVRERVDTVTRPARRRMVAGSTARWSRSTGLDRDRDARAGRARAARLPGEVVAIRADGATAQAYEYTGGLAPGAARPVARRAAVRAARAACSAASSTGCCGR